MTVIPLDTIRNPKQASVLRHISDVFDQHRGNIPDHVALTKFNSQNHIILFNTESPELNGKTLIPFDSDKLLFAPIKIKSIVSDNPQNNTSINILTAQSGGNNNNSNNHIWEAVSNSNTIVIFMTFDKTPVAGFSVKFADAVRTKYRTSIEVGNDNREILGGISNMDSSWETNNHQFFQFSSPIEGVTRAKLAIELVGSNTDFQWKIGNISLYSNMNLESMRNLSNSGIITWSQVSNSTVKREMDEGPGEDLQQQQQGQEEQSPIKTSNNNNTQPKEILPPNNKDYVGSPLLYAPNRDRQFFDNLSEEEITRISNLSRLYTTTNLPTGSKIYTFQTNEKDRTLTLKFSPLIEMNKYPDEAQTDLDKILQTGYIKKGGFKNYILTVYIKLDNITNTSNAMLLWKYGGYFFSKSHPQMSRACNLILPINNVSNDTPHAYTEYFFESLNDVTEKLMLNKDITDFKGIEQGKWIGLQFIRDVDTENKNAIQIVRINTNPMDEQGKLVNPNNFQNYLVFNDQGTKDHIPHVWSGVNEILSIVGSEFVNIYGLSLYEYDTD